MHARIFSLVCALAVARVAKAQVVLGSVVQPDSVSALSGAIVVATDARGATATRALTDARGAFVLRLSSAGTYSLVVLRIGYRPTHGPSVTIAQGDSTRVRIVAASQAVALAAMQVKERPTCRVDADTGLMVARVWEEARKAMLTSQLTSGNQPLVADWIEYDRMLDSTGRLVRQQRVRSSRSPTTHAFRSVSPQVLNERGFVIEDAAGVTFHAPDADVLLSDLFVRAHCFRLAQPTRDRGEWVGVAFSPGRDRREMREIEGTLWVDPASSELRLLEYRYLNLPDPSNEGEPGGRVEFTRLADGSWLVSRWWVRMPRVAVRSLASADGMRRTTVALNRAYLQAIQITGGEVTRASRGDSVLLRAVGPSIIVQLTTSDTAMSVADATLTLEGTDYTATGDSLGRIALTPVLAGRYRASVRTPLMQQLGMPGIVREMQTRADAAVDSIALPPPREMLSAVCPRDSLHDGEGMLHGRVLDQSARPMGNLVVTTAWQSNFAIVKTQSSASISLRDKTADAKADAYGYWRVCGVPRDTPLRVSVAMDSLADEQRVRLEDRPFTRVELVMHPRRALPGDAERVRHASFRATVEVIISDERGNVVPDVTLEVRPLGAPSRTLVSATGRFLIPDIAAGPLTIAAKRIGFAPGELTVRVEESRVLVPIRLSALRAPTLDTMRVVGVRIDQGRFREFDERRMRHQTTATITRADIETRNPTAIWQMLTNIPGIALTDRDDLVVATSRRGATMNASNQPCFLRVVLDGVALNKSDGRFDLRELPPPDQIHGVEVFAGAATIPPQYAGEGAGKVCGLIAIWTR